jgi:hypothetical protein
MSLKLKLVVLMATTDNTLTLTATLKMITTLAKAKTQKSTVEMT